MKFKEDTVYLLSDGRLFKVVDESHLKVSGAICLQFMDRDECSFVESDSLDIAVSDNSVMANMVFTASRSIHVRLNKLNKV